MCATLDQRLGIRPFLDALHIQDPTPTAVARHRTNSPPGERYLVCRSPPTGRELAELRWGFIRADAPDAANAAIPARGAGSDGPTS